MPTPSNERRALQRLQEQEAFRAVLNERRAAPRANVIDERAKAHVAVETPTNLDEELRNTPAGTYQKDHPLEGVNTWINKKNGFRVVDLEFRADPVKRTEAWITQSKKGIAKRDWDREFGRRWILYEGKPVYGTFDENRHVVDGQIIINDRIRLVSGWDSGPTDVCMAWSLALVNIRKLSVKFVDEYYIDDGDCEDFVQTVLSKFAIDWARFGGTGMHFADQAVFTESKIEKKSFADILRRFGINPIAGEISFAKRRASVESLLKDHGSFEVHERCKNIIEALGGGYVYGKVAGGVGGQYKETPLKNEFSHIANTVEYICSRLTLVGQPVAFEGRPLPRMSLV